MVIFFQEHDFFQLCYSPNGKLIAQAYHGVLFVYDLTDNGKTILIQRFTKKHFFSKKLEVDDIHYLKFLPDNQNIFVVSTSGEFLVKSEWRKKRVGFKNIYNNPFLHQ